MSRAAERLLYAALQSLGAGLRAVACDPFPTLNFLQSGRSTSEFAGLRGFSRRSGGMMGAIIDSLDTRRVDFPSRTVPILETLMETGLTPLS
jgi:hypothetical protein